VEAYRKGSKTTSIQANDSPTRQTEQEKRYLEMKVWGISTDTAWDILRAVSRERYSGNLAFKRLPELTGHTERSPIRFTLTVKRAANPGGRVSASGRRVAAACWHCHRDVMKMIFAINPNARIKTTLADYRGRSNFELTFDRTGYSNCGSMAEPFNIMDACHCE
jgi:hypothetical protein